MATQTRWAAPPPIGDAALAAALLRQLNFGKTNASGQSTSESGAKLQIDVEMAGQAVFLSGHWTI
jgi:hypothetical protein